MAHRPPVGRVDLPVAVHHGLGQHLHRPVVQRRLAHLLLARPGLPVDVLDRPRVGEREVVRPHPDDGAVPAVPPLRPQGLLAHRVEDGPREPRRAAEERAWVSSKRVGK